MSLKFCKSCGTLYDDKTIGCPKCAGKQLEQNGNADVTDLGMPPEEVRRRRKSNWIQLVIGIPALIGFFYLVFYLAKLLVD